MCNMMYICTYVCIAWSCICLMCVCSCMHPYYTHIITGCMVKQEVSMEWWYKGHSTYIGTTASTGSCDRQSRGHTIQRTHNTEIITAVQMVFYSSRWYSKKVKYFIWCNRNYLPVLSEATTASQPGNMY